jgi:hypothetical protein
MRPFMSVGLIPRASLRGCSLNTAQILRAIGQTLERLSIDKFKLHYGDYSMVIRESAKRGDKQFRDSRIILPRLRDLHYSFQEMESLDRQGRGHRLNPEGLPDSNSLTNVLRTAGGLVDLKSGQLVGVTRSDDRCLEIRYETMRGGIQGEILDASDLHSLFVSFYLKRADRRQALVSHPSLGATTFLDLSK